VLKESPNGLAQWSGFGTSFLGPNREVADAAKRISALLLENYPNIIVPTDIQALLSKAHTICDELWEELSDVVLELGHELKKLLIKTPKPAGDSSPMIGSVSHDQSKAKATVAKLNRICDVLLLLSRDVLGLSRLGRGAPKSVFVSHAGPQKGGHADALSKMLQGQGISHFFDEIHLKLIEAQFPVDMMHCEMINCEIAVAVLSEDFFTAPSGWPLIELSLFGARLRRKHKLRQLIIDNLTSSELVDYNFCLLPDFFNPDNSKWCDQVIDLPLPIDQWPTGKRYEARLERHHLGPIVKAIYQFISS
jgi:hypothetical protein